MQNAAEIYQNAVRQMPSFERLRLATLILEDLTEERAAPHKTKKLSVLELLENHNAEPIFQTVAEVDEHLESGAWVLGTLNKIAAQFVQFNNGIKVATR